jgi:hypothetical protein
MISRIVPTPDSSFSNALITTKRELSSSAYNGTLRSGETEDKKEAVPTADSKPQKSEQGITRGRLAELLNEDL